jgi:hypothetical protein
VAEASLPPGDEADDDVPEDDFAAESDFGLAFFKYAFSPFTSASVSGPTLASMRLMDS